MKPIVFGTRVMWDELIALWQECFGDSREYVSFYLEQCFTSDTILVYCVDGKPASMLSLLPVFLCFGGSGECVPGRYVYAVATKRAYRGQGYAGALISEAKRRFSGPLVLKPGEMGLYAYYERMGFQTLCYKRQAKLWKQEDVLDAGAWLLPQVDPESSLESAEMKIPRYGKASLPYAAQSILPEEYRRIRDAYFGSKRIGYVSWPGKGVAYALRENAFVGGFAVKLVSTENGKESVLLFRVEDGVMELVETTLEENELPVAVLAALEMIGPMGKNVTRIEAGLYDAGTQNENAGHRPAGRAPGSPGMQRSEASGYLPWSSPWISQGRAVRKPEGMIWFPETMGKEAKGRMEGQDWYLNLTLD